MHTAFRAGTLLQILHYDGGRHQCAHLDSSPDRASDSARGVVPEVKKMWKLPNLTGYPSAVTKTALTRFAQVNRKSALYSR